VVVHPERCREQREASLTRLARCEVHSMLGIEPHDRVAVLVLHGRDINRGAVVAVYGRPAWAIVTSGPPFAAARRRMGKTARIIRPGECLARTRRTDRLLWRRSPVITLMC